MNGTAPSAAPPAADIGEITRALRVILAPGQVTELRALNATTPTYRRAHTVSGYFDDPGALARAAAGIKQASGVYFVPNPVRPALRARAANRVRDIADREPLTGDGDVLARRWLPIDVDAHRPAGISSTDTGHAAALGRTRAISDFLTEVGFPAPIEADSGNGGHLLYRVDLPRDDGELVKRVLAALGALFDDQADDDTPEERALKVDQTVFNPARIWKLYGTVAGKGDHLPDRPHRLARLLDVPAALATVPRALLEALAALGPAPAAVPAARVNGPDGRTWTVPQVLDASAVGYRVKPTTFGTVYQLDRCLTSDAHRDGVAIIEMASGALAYRCLHDSCAGKTWQDAKVALKIHHDVLPVDMAGAGAAVRVNGAAHGYAANSTNVDATGRVSSLNSFLRTEKTLPDVPAFPVEVLPDVPRRLVEEGAKALGVPPDFIATPLLVFAGTVVGNALEIELKAGYRQRPNLYAGEVADPGVGKSPAQDLARYPLDELQRESYESYQRLLADWDQTADHCEAPGQVRTVARLPRPELEHFFTTDATTEGLTRILKGARGVVLALDELSTWWGGFNAYRSGKGGDRQFWLAGWSGAPIKVDRKGQEVVYVARPCLGVCGGVQPTVLPTLMAEAGQRDGFLERILWSWPDAEPSGWSEAVVADETKEQVVSLFRALRVTGATAPVHLSAEAKDAFVAWYARNTEQVRHSHSPLQRGVFAKLPNQLARLALILHCLTDPVKAVSTNVSLTTLQGAVRLVEYYRHHGNRVLSRFGAESTFSPLAARTLRVLMDAAGDWVSRTEIFAGLGRNAGTPARLITTSLSELESAGKVERRTVTPDGGGRPAEQWRAFTIRRNEFNEETRRPRPAPYLGDEFLRSEAPANGHVPAVTAAAAIGDKEVASWTS